MLFNRLMGNAGLVSFEVSAERFNHMTCNAIEKLNSKMIIIVCLLGLITHSSCSAGNVLIYTKNGKGYVHENIPASIECLKDICAKNNWTCEASDDPSIFTAEKIKTFDVLVFSNTNNETFDTDAQKKVFKDYINNGGGFVGIHSVCGSERKWPWFRANLGGKFVRHPKLQEFDLKVIDHDHPSTSFLGDIWKWEDECYFMNHLNPDIHVLLAADLRTIDDSKKAEYPGEIFGNYFPLCWYHEFEGGRQWYTALGHKPEYYKDETFRKHLAGGIKWAMKRSKSFKPAKLKTEVSGEKLTIRYGQDQLLSYQAKPMTEPVGGEMYKGSNFIHPLKTPSGFCVTGSQPDDHLHHFGVWWPWKYLVTEGRKVLCWELQRGEGMVQARRIVKHNANDDNAFFVTESEYIDRKAPGGPKVILNETAEVTVAKPVGFPARGYFVDIKISNRCASDSPVEVLKYRYSGFGFRGAASWDKDTSIILTSEGRDRDNSNFTRARWILVEGNTVEECRAGVVIMSHPDNFDSPQLLRTWNSGMTNGAVFINFNPVQEMSWILEPGKDYVQRYRLFIYDGSVNAKQAEELWKNYTNRLKTE